MNEILPDLSSSPSQVGNFIISYEQEIDIICERINPEELLNFMKTNENTEFYGIDPSFIPRAFTDFDPKDCLPVVVHSKKELTKKDLKNWSQSDTGQADAMDRNLSDGSKYSHSFQPDVIVSNSHHRSGPDGSPALMPSKSQGFVPSNLSETGELFAPVKHLTFSDIDQSSQVGDNFADSSRLVSTPNKSKPSNYYGYNYDSHMNNGDDQQSDSDSDSDNVHIELARNSDFHQLEGEPDDDLMSTGAFLPSAHGLNQEFMENFTCRSGSAFTGGNVFSPLASRGNQSHSHDRFEGRTPPLHVPSGSSPHVNQSGLNAPHLNDDEEEIQFAMSPTRKSGGYYSHSDSSVGKDSSKKASIMIDRQDYMNSDRFYEYSYPNEHTFEPIDKQPSKLAAQTVVSKNLNEYFELDYNSHNGEMKTKVTGMKSDDRDMDRAMHRQGDGDDGIVEQASYKGQNLSELEQQFAPVSRSAFEQRYLQRTQVSVKLPQAMYDTLTSNTSLEERHDAAGEDQARFEHPEDLGKENHSPKPAKVPAKPSPEKVVDLLQTQLSSLKNNSLLQDQSQDQRQYQTAQPHQDKFSVCTNDSGNHGENSTSNTSSKSAKFGTESGGSSVVANKSQSGPGKAQAPIRNGKQGASQPGQSGQQQSQIPQPSSRLLQETIAQKSKVNHKFVSNNPALSKLVPASSKDLHANKPQENATRKSTNATVCAGARKTIIHESEKSTAMKSKSVSMETLSPKQKSGPNSRRPGNRPDHNSTSHTKEVQSQNKNGPSQKEQGHTKSQGHNNSNHSHEASEESQLVTQQVGDMSLDVRGMEEVRHQLQSMLRLSSDHMSPQDRSHYEHSEIVAGFGMEMGDLVARQPDISAWNLHRKSQEEDVTELFPSFMSSHYMVDSGNVSRSDASLHSENQRLRDMVEKERYRRKHCEQYIQQLNVKLLENQQQLAVAVSTDKRKDIMIEQLDKQLAVVMEGWKRRDAEREAAIADLQQEKEEVEQTLKQQQQMINNFEHDMSQAVDALREEKERSVQAVEDLKEKLSEAESSRQHDQELLSAEHEKVDLLQQECESLREARDTLDKKLDNMQRRLHREQDEWFQREQELLQRIEEVADKNTKILQIERAKNEEQGKLAEEVMEKYQEAATKVKQLEMELDAAMREKESIKVEMGIMEAKFENAQRVLEADMHATMEKQIAAQISDVQARNEHLIEELQEKHRQQVLDLSRRQKQDTESQLAACRQELARKDEECRQQLNEMETRLTEYRQENSELKLSKQKLESTRLEILTKLQYAMQSQWNEAFSLLASTPQRKGPAPKLPVNTINLDSSQTQSVPSVSFSFPTTATSLANQISHVTTIANLSTPPRPAANRSGSSDRSSNHSSPDRNSNKQTGPSKDSTNQMSGGMQAASQSSFDKLASSVGQPHSRPEPKTRSAEEAIETATMLHLQQFQDYVNSVAQTPEWISSLNVNTQQGAESTDGPSPVSLPTPPDLAALLSTHLQNVQQQHMQRAFSSLPPSFPRPQSHSILQNTTNNNPLLQTVATHNDTQSSTHNASADIGSETQLKSIAHSVNMSQALKLQSTFTPPKISQSQRSDNHMQSSVSHADVSQSNEKVYGWNMHPSGRGLSCEDARDLSCAIPIRPPQQGEDPYLHDDDHSVISSIAGSQMGYFKGGQSFSPPTKENRAVHDDSLEDLTQHSSRLNEDYHQLTERMEQHESHQNELQHYIQMLLHKPPSESGNDDSMFSQDQEELDLDDMAQAAQLQREIDRIQELRQKQETSVKGRDNAATKQDNKLKPAVSADGTSKILNPEQLAEITQLLNQVKQNSKPSSPKVLELLDLLKQAQMEKAREELQKKGSRQGARPAVAGGAGNRSRGQPGHKRNVQFHPAKGVESTKQQTEANKPQNDRGPAKTTVAQSAKKVEKKVAGSTSKGDKGPKPAAWK